MGEGFLVGPTWDSSLKTHPLHIQKKKNLKKDIFKMAKNLICVLLKYSPPYLRHGNTEAVRGCLYCGSVDYTPLLKYSPPYLRHGNTEAVRGCLYCGSVDYTPTGGNYLMHCMDWSIGLSTHQSETTNQTYFYWCSACGKHIQSILAEQRQPCTALVWCCLSSSRYSPIEVCYNHRSYRIIYSRK